MSSKNKKRPSHGSVTWAQAIRDMIVTSMNRGQLPILGALGLAGLLIFRMPEDDISTLVFEILSSLKTGELWAYVAEFFTLGAWFAHAKIMRKMFSKEAERIGVEKSKIQNKATGVNFKSSNKK